MAVVVSRPSPSIADTSPAAAHTFGFEASGTYLGRTARPKATNATAGSLPNWPPAAVAGRRSTGGAAGSDRRGTGRCLLANSAKGYYRKKDGTPSGWLDHIQLVLDKHLADLYGRTPAADFGPKAFKAIRQRWLTPAIPAPTSTS